jgi:hypothetical protein
MKGALSPRHIAAWLAASLVMVGCSSKSNNDSAGASTDASTLSSNFNCGTGSIKGTLQIQDPTNLGPDEGAMVTAEGCNDAMTDDRGFLNATTDPTFQVKINVTKTGSIDEYGEITVLKDNFQISTYGFPESTRATIFPGLDATHGYIGIPIIGDGSGKGPCADGAGVVVSIQDHPEVKAGYLKDPGTRDDSLTATTPPPSLVALGPLPPGSYTVVATKTGCKGVPTNNGTVKFASTVTIKANTLTGYGMMMQPQ